MRGRYCVTFEYEYYVARLTRDSFHTVETLAAKLWLRVETLATCDNGGHMAWICPFGCECHKISFDEIE